MYDFYMVQDKEFIKDLFNSEEDISPHMYFLLLSKRFEALPIYMLPWHYELQYLTGKFLTFYTQKDTCLCIR